MSKTAKTKIDPEFGIDSRYKSIDRQLADGKKLMQARLERLNSLSRDQIIKAKLLQLKLKIEEYLYDQECESHHHFTKFLATYIDTLYAKRTMFAKDINITPVGLSQILNNHREPKKEFMFRLMIHSELAYKNVCDFPKQTWYKVYYHEKLCNTMSNQDKWQLAEKKNVKIENAALD